MSEENNQRVAVGRLVNWRRLLEILFDPDTRPCRRWVRTRVKDGTLPHYKIGGKLCFDPAEVRAALAKNNAVNS